MAPRGATWRQNGEWKFQIRHFLAPRGDTATWRCAVVREIMFAPPHGAKLAPRGAKMAPHGELFLRYHDVMRRRNGAIVAPHGAIVAPRGDWEL